MPRPRPAFSVDSRARLVQSLVVITAFALIRLGSRHFPRGAAGAVLMALTAVVFFGGVLYWGLFRVGGIGLRDVGWRGDRLGRDLLLGVLGCLVGMLGLTLILSASWQVSPAQVLAAVLARSWAVRLQLLFTMGVMAAFVEETLFRGHLQPTLTARYGHAFAIVATSALFTVAHFEFGALRMVCVFFQGIVFGLLRGRERSLWAPAAAHALLWGFMI